MIRFLVCHLCQFQFEFQSLFKHPFMFMFRFHDPFQCMHLLLHHRHRNNHLFGNLSRCNHPQCKIMQHIIR